MNWLVHALLDTVPSASTGTVSTTRYSSSSHHSAAESSRSPQDEEERQPPPNHNNLIEGMVIDFQRLSQHLSRLENVVDVVEDEEESLGGQTILSSAPSAPTIAEEARAEVVRVGPAAVMATSPLFASLHDNDPLSISTVESVEIDRNGMEDNESLAASTCSFRSAPLSFQPSLLDSAITFSSDNSSWRQESFRSATTSSQQNWRTGANNGSQQHTAHPNNYSPTTVVIPDRRGQAATTTGANNVVWYAHFSDEDWQVFRNSAKMILQALGMNTLRASNNLRPLVLPPLPPPEHQQSVLTGQQSFGSSSSVPAAIDILPSCFVCAFCQDAIVGALTLDCDCRTNVCTACWEYYCCVTKHRHHHRHGAAFGLARDLGFEIVSTSSSSSSSSENNRTHETSFCCPTCVQPVNHPLSCHALDVAMLQMVQSLPPREQPGIARFQQAYYTRLQVWRDEVVRRRQEQFNDDDNDEEVLQNAYVAQLIQEEEEILWRQERSVVRARKHCFPEVTAVSFLLAMASIGFRVLLSQNARSACRS